MQADATTDNKKNAVDEYYMLRCLQLAKNSIGAAAPNPAVGCVIVYNQKIIGEGYTSAYGGPHAEVNAIGSVKDKSLLSASRLFVTLEPCAHFGKTPPCSDLIIKYNIPEVVIGCRDPHPKVAGKGIDKLRRAGCKVITGILENKCRTHHKRFLCYHENKRPYIILKWAQSADGYIAPDATIRKDDHQPYWITNERTRQLVHKWRSKEQAILVGTKTVLEDNPELTTRRWYGNSPMRLILDSDLRISEDFHVLDDKTKTIILTQKLVADNEKDATKYERIDFKGNIAQQIAAVLYDLKITSLIIEGGAQTLSTFINAGIWDEARILTGSAILKKGIKAPAINGKIIKEFNIIEDRIKVIIND